jgi:hypothetical protein
MCSGIMPMSSIPMQPVEWQATAALMPGESHRLCRIGSVTAATGGRIARCRSGKSLRGHAATLGPKPCGHAPRPSSLSDAASAVAFTSAAVDGVGSERLAAFSGE